MRKNYTKSGFLLGLCVTFLSHARPASAQMEMDPIASKHTELAGTASGRGRQRPRSVGWGSPRRAPHAV